jgi:hypothetical protein
MNCEFTRRQLSLFLFGELSPEEEQAFDQHVKGCEKCRQALSREKALHAALDAYKAEPPPGLLSDCRQRLRSRLHEVEVTGGGLRGFWQMLRRPLWLPAGALTLMVLGFFAGRFTASIKAASDGPVTTQIRYVQPDAPGRVRIVLDETRQRVLSGDARDEDVRRLLLAAARDASDPGLRVESVDILRKQTDSAEVRQTLLQALQHDPNPGVRLKALDGLTPFASKPEMRKVLAHVLLSDENPGVRTQAVDLLVQHEEAGMAGVFQELLQKESNNYVRLRCEKALRDMNASVEMF